MEKTNKFTENQETDLSPLENNSELLNLIKSTNTTVLQLSQQLEEHSKKFDTKLDEQSNKFDTKLDEQSNRFDTSLHELRDFTTRELARVEKSAYVNNIKSSGSSLTSLGYAAMLSSAANPEIVAVSSANMLRRTDFE